MQLEQIIVDDDLTECSRLCRCDAIKYVNKVTEVRGQTHDLS